MATKRRPRFKVTQIDHGNPAADLADVLNGSGSEDGDYKLSRNVGLPIVVVGGAILVVLELDERVEAAAPDEAAKG